VLGRVWLGWKVLVLCRQPWKGLLKCHFQISSWFYTIYTIIWNEKLQEKDVSNFRPVRCKAYVHLNKERREKGKHTSQAVEAIHLGFAFDCNVSAYKFYISSSGKCIISNQAQFDEESFPDRN
jgi:hypothetical protein